VLTADDAAADAAFELAYELHTDPFGSARTRLLHGSRLRRAGRRVAAREQLRVAAAGFDALGMDGWTARATAELAATGQRPRRGPRDGDQLTSQETRVALLVARGLSNRDVAAALFVSPRTVEHHVSSVLRKRGLHSRTELAAAFGDQDGFGAR
jgi:DNA-binding NarL/FixJ family response regulator